MYTTGKPIVFWDFVPLCLEVAGGGMAFTLVGFYLTAGAGVPGVNLATLVMFGALRKNCTAA